MTLPTGRPKQPAIAPTDRPRMSRKIRGTFLLPHDLLEELRDASYWSRQSLARIAERALRAELAELKRQHNSGGDFAERPAA